jgi:hypothetical protein
VARRVSLEPLRLRGTSVRDRQAQTGRAFELSQVVPRHDLVGWWKRLGPIEIRRECVRYVSC